MSKTGIYTRKKMSKQVPKSNQTSELDSFQLWGNQADFLPQSPQLAATPLSVKEQRSLIMQEMPITVQENWFNPDAELQQLGQIDQTQLQHEINENIFSQNPFVQHPLPQHLPAVIDVSEPNSPATLQRTDSLQLDELLIDQSAQIRLPETGIVTFSRPIDNFIYFYNIRDQSMPIISVYTGEFTTENPDNCLCLSNVTTNYFSTNSSPFFLLEPITKYNACYKQYYLFSRIFKKMISCVGGKCITSSSYENGRVLEFTQSSYCCGYYSAVAAVIYRYYQLRCNFPGTEDFINFETITIDEINHFVDATDFESNTFLMKLFNLSISYTSYFNSYILKNPLPNITSSFPLTTNQNCAFNYNNGMIQLATIYATTGTSTITYHHFCTYNIGRYVIISDAWAAGNCRRPLWTRFSTVDDFNYIVSMMENNISGLSTEQLEVIKLFFLQPYCSTFLPNIKICYITVDFLINDKKLFYSDGREMVGLNEIQHLMGGKRHKKVQNAQNAQNALDVYYFQQEFKYKKQVIQNENLF